jgi:adenosine deaminase
MSLASYLHAAPKVELHVHLEGSIQPATLLTLARRNGVVLPAETEQGLREWFAFRDFDHFIQVYFAMTRCLKTLEDYELIAYEFGAEMARQHVRYAEVTFTPSTHHMSYGIPFDTYFAGLTRGRERAWAEFGVELAWVFDTIHFVDDLERTRRLAKYTTSVAIDGMRDGVVALGLGGPEVGHSFERIAPNFERARAAGLHSAPHAGETRGPESVWGALRLLGAERIGHGVRAIEDPALVAYLAEQRIPLEVCPTSNVRLGIYPDLAAHPLRGLHDAGVPITINSDDPPLFNTTLDDEVRRLADPFGLSVEQIDEVLLNGVRYSFLPDERKQMMEAEFRQELDALKRVHFGRN